MNKYFIVLSRYTAVHPQAHALIMLLEDREKADKLAEFLNAGGYFKDAPVTVETEEEYFRINPDGIHYGQQLVPVGYFNRKP